MSAIVYNKKIAETPEQGTGDKSFILEPKKVYQVPLPFTNDWEKMRLGVIWSWTSTSGSLINTDGQYNTPVTDYTDSTGVVLIKEDVTDQSWVLDEYSFFGLAKKTPNQINIIDDFIGWRGDILPLSNVTDDVSGVLNKLGDTSISSQRYPYFNFNYSGTDINPSRFVWMNGRNSIVDDQIVYAANASGDNFSNYWVAPRIYGLKNPNPSGISPEGEENFASFWGLDVTRTGNSSKHSYEVEPIYYNDTNNLSTFYGGNREPGEPANLNDQYNNCRISDPSKKNIKNIIYGKDIYSRNFEYDAVRKIQVTDTSAVYDPDPNSQFVQDRLVDSVFFYNGFSGINIRIHSWAVIKIK